MTAISISELADQIRRAPTPTGAKRIAEFRALRSFAFAPLFTEIFGCDGACGLDQGSDPPDYCLSTLGAKISIEVTSLTTGKLRVFQRERFNPNSYTSMLRSEKSKPDARFWNNLNVYALLDDSEAIPHYESIGDLDRDYYEMAHDSLTKKSKRLGTYRPQFKKNVLLIHDELSEFKSDFKRRIPVLRSVLNSIRSPRHFDAIVLVDGNHYSGAKAFKLWGA